MKDVGLQAASPIFKIREQLLGKPLLPPNKEKKNQVQDIQQQSFYSEFNKAMEQRKKGRIMPPNSQFVIQKNYDYKQLEQLFSRQAIQSQQIREETLKASYLINKGVKIQTIPDFSQIAKQKRILKVAGQQLLQKDFQNIFKPQKKQQIPIAKEDLNFTERIKTEKEDNSKFQLNASELIKFSASGQKYSLSFLEHGSSYYRQLMKKSRNKQQARRMFFQSINEFNTEPSQQLQFQSWFMFVTQKTPNLILQRYLRNTVQISQNQKSVKNTTKIKNLQMKNIGVQTTQKAQPPQIKYFTPKKVQQNDVEKLMKIRKKISFTQDEYIKKKDIKVLLQQQKNYIEMLKLITKQHYKQNPNQTLDFVFQNATLFQGRLVANQDFFKLLFQLFNQLAQLKDEKQKLRSTMLKANFQRKSPQKVKKFQAITTKKKTINKQKGQRWIGRVVVQQQGWQK